MGGFKEEGQPPHNLAANIAHPAHPVGARRRYERLVKPTRRRRKSHCRGYKRKSGRSQAGCPRAAMIERHYGTMIEGAAADITRRLDAFDARHARDLERDHED